MMMITVVREGGFPDWAAPESRCNLPSSLSLLSLQTLAVAVCWSGIYGNKAQRQNNGGVALLAMESNKPVNMKVKQFSLQSLELNCHLTSNRFSPTTSNIYRDQHIALKWFLVPNTKIIAPNSWSEMYEIKHVHFPNPICEIFTRSPAASLIALTHLRAR